MMRTRICPIGLEFEREVDRQPDLQYRPWVKFSRTFVRSGGGDWRIFFYHDPSYTRGTV